MHSIVDIIVPIYNRAHCIAGLIDQLKMQSFQDFRVIFVDDGSTDHSYEVLQDFLRDAPFAYCLIQKENGGAASARNAGLRAASARWIAFVDSDDQIKPHYLEYMVRAVTEAGADLGVCHYQTIVEGQHSEVCPEEPFAFQGISPAECMRMYCTNWLGVYCLLISSELVRSKNLYFDENCFYCEDAPYIADVIEASTKVAHVDQQLYLYYTHQGSLSRSPKTSKFISGIESYRRMEKSIAGRSSEAARVFDEMGSVRYYIAVLRKAAVQMAYKDFVELSEVVDFQQYRDKIRNLTLSQRIASLLFCFSKTVFYYSIRMMFRD